MRSLYSGVIYFVYPNKKLKIRIFEQIKTSGFWSTSFSCSVYLSLCLKFLLKMILVRSWISKFMQALLRSIFLENIQAILGLCWLRRWVRVYQVLMLCVELKPFWTHNFVDVYIVKLSSKLVNRGTAINYKKATCSLVCFDYCQVWEGDFLYCNCGRK